MYATSSTESCTSKLSRVRWGSNPLSRHVIPLIRRGRCIPYALHLAVPLLIPAVAGKSNSDIHNSKRSSKTCQAKSALYFHKVWSGCLGTIRSLWFGGPGHCLYTTPAYFFTTSFQNSTTLSIPVSSINSKPTSPMDSIERSQHIST